MSINTGKIKKEKTIKELLEFSILNIDKPSGPTSFDISDFVRKKLGLRKTSHFGTLDPKVTGVLPIALNRACRLTGDFLGHDKTYVGIMRFHEEVELNKIRKIIEDKFTGKIMQKPPVRSRVVRQLREREVKRFEIIEQEGKDFLFVAEVQGGTYIRKLIDDLGKELGVNAHMLELRRVQAGIFSENDPESVNLYDFEKAVEEYSNGDEENLRKILIPAEIVSRIYPVVMIKKDNLKQIYTGKPLMNKDLVKKEDLETGEKIVVFCESNFIGTYRVVNEKDIFAKADFVIQPIKS